MAIPPIPSASDANIDSQASIAAAITAEEAVFIASTTVLINNAISNGFFQIEPFLPFLVSPTFVKNYFTNLGYTVLFPVCNECGCNCYGNSGYPYEPCFVAGFPEVLPPGYIPWNCECGYNGPARIGIYWSSVSVAENALLLETGDFFELMGGTGFLLLTN